MFVKDLESLKYAELQKLAKSAGIKANQKVDKLVKALQDYYLELEDDSAVTSVATSDSGDKQGAQKKPAMKKMVWKKNMNGSDTRKTSKGPVIRSAFGADPMQTKIAQATAKVGNGGSKTTISPKDSTTKSPVMFSPFRRLSALLSSFTKATPTEVPKKADDGNTASGEAIKGTRKRRRTFELDEPTLSHENTPTVEGQPDRRVTRQRVSPTDTQSGLQETEPSIKRVRKNTYNRDSPPQRNINDAPGERVPTPSSSPGTVAMIEEMDANLSSAERKAKLMSALDKKVKNKVHSSPVPASQPSQIPRFMAFLANKKADGQKPLTPGNKDWAKIHKKEFSKFDSLDEYLVKKQQRMEKLTGSAKKSAAVAVGGPRIVKPISRLQVPMKAFVPTVTSTKNITFNFGKTPVTLNGKTPLKQKPTEEPITQGISHTPRTQGLVGSTKKSFGMANGGRATPFIFTGNTSCLNTTEASQKKAFNLKASLAKPLSWKPHTGKLQPLDFNKPQPTSATKSHLLTWKERPSRQAMASKTRPVGAKDVRRTKDLDRRNNQKYIDMMKRRGLLN